MATRSTTLTSPTFAGRLGIAATDTLRTIAPAAFAGWLAWVIAAGRPNLAGNVHDATVQLQVLFGVLFLAYAAYLVLHRSLPGRTPLDWCAAAVVATYALSSFASVDPRVSVESSLLVGVCIAAFYVFHEGGFLTTATLHRGLVFTGGVVCFLALLQVASFYAEWFAALDSIRGLGPGDFLPPAVLRSRGVLDHPNHLGMFLNLVLPFALVLVVRPRMRWDRAAGAVVCLLAFASLFFSLSRGAWLGTIASLLVFGCLLYLSARQRPTLRAVWEWGSARRYLVAAGVCLAVVLAAGVLTYLVTIQPSWLFRQTAGGRVDAIRAAFDIFGDHPLSGAGPNTFWLLNETYGIDKPDELTIAHNVYAQVLADVGVLGALAIGAGAIVFVTTSLRAWRHAGRDQKLLLAAGMSAIAATMVHALFDSPPAWNTILLPLALVVALTLRAVPSPSRSVALPALVPRLVVTVLIPVIIAGWLAFDRGHQAYDESLAALEDGRLDVAAAAAVEAAAKDPQLYAYQLHAGVMLATQDLEDRAALEESVRYLRRAVELDPHSSLAYANLALAHQARGDDGAAVEAARKAIAESPFDGTIAIVAGTVFERAGHHDEAVEAYALALREDPGLAQSPFWSTTAARGSLRAEVIRIAGIDACTLGRDAALFGVYSEDLSILEGECRALVQTPGGEGKRASLALILHAQGRYEAARTEGSLALRSAAVSPDKLIMSAVVLDGDDLSAVREHLFQAARYGRSDAAVLLASTYEEPGWLPPAPLSLLALPAREGRMPAMVSDRLARVAPAGAESAAEVMQGFRTGRMYYVHSALREAPRVLLIPGDWSEMAAPSLLVALSIHKTD